MSRIETGLLVTAACVLLWNSTPWAFVPTAPRAPLLGSSSTEVKGNFQGGFAGTSNVAGGIWIVVVAAATCRAFSPVARRAAAVKKKGVRVVEGKEIPWNLFSPKSPYKGVCVSNESITTKSPLPNWETTHCVIRHDKKVPYLEGQSIGIIAPGPDKKGEKPAKVRLYSIASSSPGDDETYETVSLVVKRVLEVEGMGWFKYVNVEDDAEFPGKGVYRGVCSTHICDMKAGDEALITGPVGAEMLLPEDPESNIIMMATGTGIAPFRSHLRCLMHDKVSAGKFKGLAWLFLGVPYEESILYDEEWKQMKADHPDNFRYDYAISNSEKSDKNKINGQMWVQHRMMEYTQELWDMVKKPNTHIYMCGLKGMESGFQECFEELATAEGLEWPAFVKELKKEKRYHVEVY